MARIAGVNLPADKPIAIALRYIYGIGPTSSRSVLEQAKIETGKRTKELSDAEVDRLRNLIEKQYKVEGDLRMQIGQNIKRLVEINSYRGLRHKKHLPVRGQQTKTNSRTVRGNKRMTAASGKKPSGQKT